MCHWSWQNGSPIHSYLVAQTTFKNENRPVGPNYLFPQYFYAVVKISVCFQTFAIYVRGRWQDFIATTNKSSHNCAMWPLYVALTAAFLICRMSKYRNVYSQHCRSDILLNRNWLIESLSIELWKSVLKGWLNMEMFRSRSVWIWLFLQLQSM